MCSSPKVTTSAQTLLPPSEAPKPLALPEGAKVRNTGLSALRIAGSSASASASPSSGLSMPASSTG